MSPGEQGQQFDFIDEQSDLSQKRQLLEPQSYLINVLSSS
jgi:hypothetical protein